MCLTLDQLSPFFFLLYSSSVDVMEIAYAFVPLDIYFLALNIYMRFVFSMAVEICVLIPVQYD